ncbi:hypothetical protein OF122_06795 [Pelagibacterium flavum]|uniref:Uncharacterized protein n=1 Tax=Pelagibacterium flavum TaxID=2984530 RepID=A0ABY6IS49_9HYPH|nr:hypothetical protein [Pelagibacterium sp. YIM 151497]UYQ73457.1 hypothetical protein OF122_06795 [Pelagibacterium sp. YIM 151497]
MNSAREEFLKIAHAALAGDPLLPTLGVEGDGPDFRYSVDQGPLPSKLAGTEFSPAPPFARDDLLKVLATATRSRWQRGQLPTQVNLDDLSSYFKACRVSLAVDPGWFDLLFSVFHLAVGLGAANRWETLQVKEKYGTLRIYYEAEPDVVDGLDRIIEAAEHLSGHICEKCGAPGELRPGGYVRTLCDEHAGGSNG